MKLLFDQNISHRILPLIAHVYPQATHIKNHGLINASDHEIFVYARQQNFVAVVSRDDDFVKLVKQMSAPPKVIHLRTKNANTDILAQILNANKTAIEEFLTDQTADYLNIMI